MAYDSLYKHYEDCFKKHGDSHLGVDWPNEADTLKRHAVMQQIARNDASASFLDIGCGLGHFWEFLHKQGISANNYIGLDISEIFVEQSKIKFPEVPFVAANILTTPQESLPTADYLVLNGVFTEKRDMSYPEMWDFFTAMLQKAFATANKGIAFNVMSKQVDWERDDLFHVPLDELAWFLSKNLSRHFVIRNDYGLYEYTTYVYKQPQF